MKQGSRYIADKTDLKCASCGNDLRRLSRNGFLERKVYSYFGYYPWECPICRQRIFVKKKNKHKRSSFPETTAI